MGQEFRALSEIVGGHGKVLELYQSFRDPHSAFDPASKEYSFMTHGPVSPLSFAGPPSFLVHLFESKQPYPAHPFARVRAGTGFAKP